MSERSWTRRDFGMAVAPALVAIPVLAAHAGSTGPVGARAKWSGPEEMPELWPEAQATIAFYRKHLPGGLSLAGPTPALRDPAGVSTRSVSFRVMDGDAEVGQLDLAAMFTPDQLAPLWQATMVAGPWYGRSITNAYQTGAFA